MSETAQATEANDDGEQDANDAAAEEVEEAEQEAESQYADQETVLIEPHEDIGTYNAAKVAFARMLVDEIRSTDAGADFPFEPDDIVWAEGTAHTQRDGDRVGLAAEAVDRTRRPIWTVQVYNQVIRAASVDADDGMTEVTTETVDGDQFQTLYEAHLDTFLDSANVLSVNGLNDGLRKKGFHPDSFLVAPPEPETDSEGAGPSEDVFVTPSGTQLEPDEVELVNFDPVTGDDLQDVEIRSEAELAEMSEEERDDYLTDEAEYDIPEIPESDEEEGDEEPEAEDLTSVVGVGDATAEKLREAGIETPSELREADNDELQEAGLSAAQIGTIRGKE